MERQDSMDQLKFMLESYALSMANNHRGRRKIFMHNRQHSLPSHLDSLNEEDENKPTNTPLRTEMGSTGKLKTFLEEEERSYSSLSSSKESLMSSEASINPITMRKTDSESSCLESRQASETSYYPSSLAYSTDSENIVDAELPYTTGADVAAIIKDTYPAVEEIVSNKVDMPMKTYPVHSTSSSPLTTSESESTSSFHIKTSKPESVITQQSTPVIPSIIVTSNKPLMPQSSSSMEITDIMGGKRSGTDKYEPALLTLVLSDVEDNVSVISSGGTTSASSGSKSTLSISPRCSSISPVPISPITVIEVDKLDNVNDSIDSGESPCEVVSLSSSFLQSQFSGDDQEKLVTINEDEQLHLDKELQDINGTSNDGKMHCDINVTEVAPNNLLNMADCAIEADDGRLSPLVIFTNRSFEQSPMSSPGGSNGERNSAFESRYSPLRIAAVSSPGSTHDVGVQEDDGTLSPLLLLSEWEDKEDMTAFWQPEVCIVSNSFTQTDTMTTGFLGNGKSVSTQTDYFTDTSSIDTEPDRFYMTSSTQTSFQHTDYDNHEPICCRCKESLANSRRSTNGLAVMKPKALESCDSGPSPWASCNSDQKSEDSSQLLLVPITKPSIREGRDDSPATSEYFMAMDTVEECPPPQSPLSVANGFSDNDSNASSSDELFTGDKLLMNRYIRQVSSNEQRWARSNSLEIRRSRISSEADSNHTTGEATVIRRNMSLEARRRSSLQRQKSFEEWNATIRELDNEIDMSEAKEEPHKASLESVDQEEPKDTVPSHIQNDSSLDIPSVSIWQGDSTEKDSLASSIVTDLFQTIPIDVSENNEVLKDIRRDYAPYPAGDVNENADKNLRNNTVESMSSVESHSDAMNPHLAPGIGLFRDPLITLPSKSLTNTSLLYLPRATGRTSAQTSCTSSLASTSSFDEYPPLPLDRLVSSLSVESSDSRCSASENRLTISGQENLIDFSQELSNLSIVNGSCDAAPISKNDHDVAFVQQHVS